MNTSGGAEPLRLKMHETLTDRSEEMCMILALCVVGGQVWVSTDERMMLHRSVSLIFHTHSTNM